LAVICPAETGLASAARHTCTSCARCFDDKGGAQ
jgi:hypothetical protein